MRFFNCQSLRICLVLIILSAVPIDLSAQSDPHLTPYVYWVVSDDQEIWRAELDGGTPRLILHSFTIRAVAVDPSNQWLYWAQGGPPFEILRSRLDGSQRETLITDLGGISEIELDLVNKKIYWIDFFDDAMWRADLDGSGSEKLLNAIAGMRHLALEPAGGNLFYNEDSGPAGMDRIIRANLDASSGTEIVASISGINDLEADASSGKLFVSTVSSLDGVTRVDFDGLNQELILAEAGIQTLRVRGLNVYYMDRDSNDLFKMDLDGGNPGAVSSGFPYTPQFDLDVGNGKSYVRTFSVTEGLHRVDLDGSNPQLLAHELIGAFHDLDMDHFSQRLLFTGERFTQLLSTRPDGQDIQLLVSHPGLARAKSLAIDPANARVYWSNVKSGSGTGIYSSNLDGSGIAMLYRDEGNDPHDVALDLVNHSIFWTQNIDGANAENTLGVIRRADLNGEHVSDIVTDETSSIRGIAIDNSNGRIYWTDHFRDEIRSADLDGGDRSVTHAGLVNPHDVFVDEVTGKLYWSDGTSNNSDPTGAIRRSELDGSNPEDVFTGLSAEVRDFKVVYLSGEIFSSSFETVVRPLNANVIPSIAIASEAGPVDGEFMINLSLPSIGTTMVNYTLSGTAVSPGDYQPLSGSVSFADGQMHKTIAVEIVTDKDVEPQEQLVLILASGAGYSVGAPASANLTIAADVP